MSEIVCSKEKRWRGEHFSKADLIFLCEPVAKKKPYNWKMFKEEPPN
jgi:hypothetical protein